VAAGVVVVVGEVEVDPDVAGVVDPEVAPEVVLEVDPVAVATVAAPEWVGSWATARPIPTAATVAVTPRATVVRRTRTSASSRDRTAASRLGRWRG
jgi:hypothetical protein